MADNNLTRACRTLALANTYAEDGAIITAIELTSEALALLCKERQRRMAAGLLPRMGFGKGEPAPAPRVKKARR